MEVLFEAVAVRQLPCIDVARATGLAAAMKAHNGGIGMCAKAESRCHRLGSRRSCSASAPVH